MSDDRLITDTLRSMGSEPDYVQTDDALRQVHERSARRRRHRTVVRSTIGAVAAALLVVAVVALDGPGRDDSQSVIADQPTETTQPPWMVTTSLLDPSAPTVPLPQTPPPLQADQLDDVVGVELRTWYFDDQTDGFWSATPSQTAAIVQALRSGGEPFLRPEVIDHAYVRFELSNGSYALLEMDVESGWIEPDGRLTEALTRQIREGLNDVVGHPWEDLDLGDDNPYLQGIIQAAAPPWASPEHAFEALLDAFASHDADARGLFGELTFEGHGPLVRISTRGGDDSGRGADYRFSLIEEPSGWEIGGALVRVLCLRSPSRWNDAAGTWSCL